MFGSIGTSEIIIIAGVALIVIGPENFPQFAKIALRAFRDFKGYVADLKSEVQNEINPLKGEFRELARQNPEDYIESLVKAVEDDLEDKEEPPSESLSEPDKSIEQPSDSDETGSESSDTVEIESQPDGSGRTPYDDVYDPERMEN